MIGEGREHGRGSGTDHHEEAEQRDGQCEREDPEPESILERRIDPEGLPSIHLAAGDGEMQSGCDLLDAHAEGLLLSIRSSTSLG